MQCARKRWGAGTTCERPPNTPASNELQDRLAKMKAERENQDGMWNDPTPAQSTDLQTTNYSQPLLQKQQSPVTKK
jgi:hypothetical protein